MIPEGFPKWTLGWDILEWGSEMLAQPDGKDRGDPWIYSNEQAKFILWFYAVNEHGQFIYRKAVLERPKGWGKSPLLAAICCTEFMGPVDFAGWDAKGLPVGRPAPTPLVQIAAISDSQAENTYALCREMMLQGPIMDYYPDLDVMLSKSTYPGGRTLEKVTASPRGREGNRATFIVMDETHLWVPAEKGPELWEALSRNLAKTDHRYIATTNAPVPGQGSVAEIEYIAWQEAQERGSDVSRGLLFDTRQVHPTNIRDREEAFPLLEYVYGDASVTNGGWVNLERIWEEINDPSVREAVARRFYFNQRVLPPSSWLDYEAWMACFTDRQRRLNRDDPVALGFKSGLKWGGSYIVACRLTDGALFPMGWWETPQDERRQKVNPKTGKWERLSTWECPWNEVDARMRNILDGHNIVKLLVDPVTHRDVSAGWNADYEGIIEEFWFSNKAKFSRAVEQFEQAVEARAINWNSENISRHVLNCHSEEVANGYIIRKERPESEYYIGGAQACLLALEAAHLAIADGAFHESGILFSTNPVGGRLTVHRSGENIFSPTGGRTSLPRVVRGNLAN